MSAAPSRSMPRRFPTGSSTGKRPPLALIALLLLTGAACKQDEGEYCEIDGDCSSGLKCEEQLGGKGRCTRGGGAQTPSPSRAFDAGNSPALGRDAALDRATAPDGGAAGPDAVSGPDLTAAPDAAAGSDVRVRLDAARGPDATDGSRADAPGITDAPPAAADGSPVGSDAAPGPG